MLAGRRWSRVAGLRGKRGKKEQVVMQENVRRQADLLARCRVNDRWETGSGQLTCDVDKSAYSVVYNYDNTSISNKGNSMLRKIMPGQYGKKTWINTNAKAKKVKHECILLCKHTRMLREANSQRRKRENNSKPVEGLGVSSRRKHLCRRERKWRDDGNALVHLQLRGEENAGY